MVILKEKKSLSLVLSPLDHFEKKKVQIPLLGPSLKNGLGIQITQGKSSSPMLEPSFVKRIPNPSRH